MQRPDEAKRHTIIDAAAALFASRPYHEVRLDDVAEAARVGKGTLYVYFKSKDDLYLTLVREAFAQLVDRLDDRIEASHAEASAWATLEAIVRELVLWAGQYPDFFHLIRTADAGPATDRLCEKRRRLGGLIEAVIEQGVRTGELDDPQPALTAQFLPACVRAAIRNGPPRLRQDEIVRHILRVLSAGIRRTP